MAQMTTYYKGNMLVESKLGSHRVIIDIPPNLGGDRGSTPPERLLASLGVCIDDFVAGYCKQIGLDVGNMTVDISYDKLQSPTPMVDLKVKVNLPHADLLDREEAFDSVIETYPIRETISSLDEFDFDLAERQTSRAGRELMAVA